MSSIVKPGIFRNKPEVASCYVIQNKSFSWLWDNLKIIIMSLSFCTRTITLTMINEPHNHIHSEPEQ